MAEVAFDYSVLVVGLARDLGKKFRKDFSVISSALDGFSAVSWFVVESDSSDDTVSVLEGLAARSEGFRYVSLGSIKESFPERTERLAHCRNIYLGELNSNPRYDSVDFVLVADLDGINTRLTRAAVQSCFERSDWDACFANQKAPYYDVWTLRHPIWSPNDCWENYRFLNTVNGRKRSNLVASVFSRMIILPPSSQWIPVHSAFGGLGFYRRESLRDARYSGVSEEGTIVSDHVPLNLELSRRGHRLFINPAFINARYVEHSLRRIYVFRLLSAAWSRLKSVHSKVRLQSTTAPTARTGEIAGQSRDVFSRG